MNIELMKRKYPVGTRVKYTGRTSILGVGCVQVKPGDLGTVIGIFENTEMLNISWDNGKFVSLEPGRDPFSVVFSK